MEAAKTTVIGQNPDESNSQSKNADSEQSSDSDSSDSDSSDSDSSDSASEIKLTFPKFDKSYFHIGDDDEEQLKKLNVEQYFTLDELETLCEYELSRYRKILQNHLAMKYFGLNISKPWFIQRHEKNQNKVQQDPDEWTPKDLKNNRKIKTTFRPPVKNRKRKMPQRKTNKLPESVSPEVLHASIQEILQDLKPKISRCLGQLEVDCAIAEIDQKMANIDIKMAELAGADSAYLDFEELVNPINEKQMKAILKFSKDMEEEQQRRAGNRRYPRRSIMRKNYAELEMPDEDEFIFCDDCDWEYLGDCPVHGPLIIVEDQPAVEGDPSRARNSIPVGFVIKKSTIPGAGEGVFTTKAIPKGVRFGPYDGVIVEDPAEAMESGYCWQIYHNGTATRYIDAADESHSNWMRYVNCACFEAQQNLLAFQYAGNIYYKTFKDVLPNTELLVWYGEQYGADLGILPDDDLSNQTEPSQNKSTATIQVTEKMNNSIDSIDNELLNSSDRKIWQCDLCTKCYGLEYFYHKHKWLHHNIPLPIRILHQINRQKKLLQSHRNIQKGLLKCEINISHNAANRHSVSHDGHQSDISGELCNKAGLSSSNEEVFSCMKCGQFIGNLHLPTAAGQMCSSCRNKTVSSNSQKPVTLSADSNKHNVMLTHTGEKLHVCPKCGKGFARSSALQTHMLIHTGEKPHVCPKCGKGFNDLGNLRTHMLIHTGEKPHVCPKCGKGFTQSGALRTHMLIHTGEKPHVCPKCSKGFNVSCNLQTHMLMHTGEKPHVCLKCGKGFNRSDTLHTHMLMHTGEKLHVCPKCGKGFNVSCNLRRHMLIHTRNSDKGFNWS